MSTLLVVALKIAFLALLWAFIAMVARVVKADLFGPALSLAGGGVSQAGEPVGGPNPKRRGRSAKVARLVVVEGAGKGDTVPLQGEILVGRADDATLDIKDDYASGHHARFYRDEESWIVADLDSTNGTVVNGLRIARPTRVGDGDLVRIGRTGIRVEEPR